MAKQNTLGAGERQSLSATPSDIDKAALILAAISQAANHIDELCGDAILSGNWLALIEAASSEAHRLLTGLPLHCKDGVMLPLIGEVSHG